MRLKEKTISVQLVSKSYDMSGVDEFTERAYELGWTDGLPVLPPTEEKVGAMIEHANRDPEEVIGVISPGEGIATVEKIAINCVMAGCSTEYLPIVLAAVEALVHPAFEHMRVQCTTDGPAPLTIISGPIVKDLNFNYDEGAFAGAGHRANATVGRAVRLVLWNIGMGRPGHLAHATFGHPAAKSYLVAERPPDEGNPWEPFHVTTGSSEAERDLPHTAEQTSDARLTPEDSAVSMFPVVSHHTILAGIGSQTVDNSLHVLADSMTDLGRFHASEPRILVLNPSAANVLADSGWSKAMLQKELVARCKRPLKEIKRTAGAFADVKKDEQYHWTKVAPDPEDDEFMMPAMIGVEHLPILVTGGWAPPNGQSCILHRAHGSLVTKKIRR